MSKISFKVTEGKGGSHILVSYSFLIGSKQGCILKNQLLRLPGSPLKVPGGWSGGGPNYFHVKLQLMLRLSWDVTI